MCAKPPCSSAEWIAAALASDKRTFVEAYDHLFLVATLQVRRLRALAATFNADRGVTFGTGRREDEVYAPSVEGRAWTTPFERVVHPLVKRSEAFANMITIGRTANNDVHVLDVSVSKFHAWFPMNGERVVIDAASHNGTFVDGVRCPPKTPVRVRLGARIEFGRIPMILVDAAGCWESVRRSP